MGQNGEMLLKRNPTPLGVIFIASIFKFYVFGTFILLIKLVERPPHIFIQRDVIASPFSTGILSVLSVERYGQYAIALGANNLRFLVKKTLLTYRTLFFLIYLVYERKGAKLMVRQKCERAADRADINQCYPGFYVVLPSYLQSQRNGYLKSRAQHPALVAEKKLKLEIFLFVFGFFLVCPTLMAS